MITKEFLNKIRWDKRENPEEYEILYFDRIEKRLIPMPYKKITRIEGKFMVVESGGKETNIPLHRIRQIRKRGVVVWQSSLQDY